MHLDHKIPWNTAASHFTLIKSNPHFTPRRTDIFSLGLATQANDLNHFRRVFVAAIREFSLTRSIKLKEVPLVTESEQLFSESLRSYPERKYGLESHSENSVLHNPLSTEHQKIGYWIKRARPSQPGEQPYYSTNDGDLADAVKMLIIISADSEADLAEEALTALIRLSRHPKIPLRNLDVLSWGHGFGVDHVAARTLQIYLMINIVDAILLKNRQKNKEEVCWLEASSFFSFARDALVDYDFPAQNIPHRAFWKLLGITDSWGRESENKHRGENAELTVVAEEGGQVVIDPLAPSSTDETRTKLKEYLKMCFAILYSYDILLREWGYSDDEVEEKWNYDIVAWMRLWGCKGDDEGKNFI